MSGVNAWKALALCLCALSASVSVMLARAALHLIGVR